jgi:hypothetical protein
VILCICLLPEAAPFFAHFLHLHQHNRRIPSLPTSLQKFTPKSVLGCAMHASKDENMKNQVNLVTPVCYGNVWLLIPYSCCSACFLGLPLTLCAKEAGSSSYAVRAIKTPLRSGIWLLYTRVSLNKQAHSFLLVSYAILIYRRSLPFPVAGVDCIDCSADPAVVLAVHDGINAAMGASIQRGGQIPMRPWVMVSINDDEDPHFRKAYFDPDVSNKAQSM